MAQSKVIQVLEALTHLESFENQHYVDTLKSHLQFDDFGALNGAPSEIYCETPIDNALDLLKTQTLVLGLSRSSSYGFNATVNVNGIETKVDRTASNIMHIMYRDFLEEAIHRYAGERFDLLELQKDIDFCTTFVDHVLEPDFINNTLIAIYARGQWAYPQAIAYIYERARETLLSTSSHSNIGKRSMQIHWSPHAEKHQTLLEKDLVGSFLDAALPVHWSDESLLQGPSFPSLGKVFSLTWRTDPQWTSLVERLAGTVKHLPDIYSPGMGRLPPRTIPGQIVYGDQLQSWIKSKEAQHPDMFTGREPTNVRNGDGMPMACFVAGTKIQTNRGEVDIEVVQAGTKVLTKAPGEYGVVSDEKVYQPTFNGEHPSAPKATVYGFNGEQPFVTAGHVFFTTTGPKAIDPSIARIENPSIVVSQLGVGDVLQRLDHNTHTYTKTVIQSFTVATAPGDWVYGLHLRQGHAGARYHANGYLVAANYPEVTIKRISDRLADMPIKQQKGVIESVKSLPESISQLFGPIFNTFQTSLIRDHTTPFADLEVAHQQSQRRIREARVAAHSTSAEFILFRHDEVKDTKVLSSFSTQEATHICKVIIDNGAVMVDSQLIEYADVSHEHIKWSREVPDSPRMWEHCLLKVSSDSLIVTGSITYQLEGSSETSEYSPAHDTKLPIKDIVQVVGMQNVNTYNVLFSEKTFSEEGEANQAVPAVGEKWSPFWTIQTGLDKQGQGTFIPVVAIPALDDEFGTGEDSIYESTLAINSQNILTIDVSIDAQGQDDLRTFLDGWTEDKGPKPPVFASFSAGINLATGEMHGYYYEPSSEATEHGALHALYTAHAENHHVMKQAVIDAVNISPFAAMNLALTCDLYNPSANIHSRSLPVADLLLSATEAKRSVTELQLLEAPDPMTLNNISQNYVMAAAGLWKGPKEREVFGDGSLANSDIVPSLLKSQLSTKNKEFLETYSRALYLYSLSGNDNYGKNFSESERKKLTYWWKGKAESCLAHKQEFGHITTLATGAAFKDLVTRNGVDLEAYVNDDRDWAKEFFESVTTDAMLNNLVMSLINGRNLVNKHCMVLEAIDKDNRRYDLQLWKLIRDKSMTMLGYEGRPIDENEWPEFATKFMEQLILQVLSHDSKITNSLKKQLLLDIEELLSEYGTRDATEAAERTFGLKSLQGRLIAEVIRELGGLIGKGGVSFMPKVATKIKEKYDKLNQKYPRTMGSVLGIISIVGQGFQIYNAAKFLYKWDKLSNIAKAEAIIQIVESVTRMIADAADLLLLFKEHPTDAKEISKGTRRFNRRLGGSKPRVKVQVEEIEMEVFKDHSLAQVNPEAEGRPLEVQMGEVVADPAIEEKVMRRFKLSAKVGRMAVQAVVIVANAAVAAGLGIQIATEWKYEKNVGILALDILTLATTAAQTLVEITELVLVGLEVEVMAIPVAGAVLAAVGIILTIVSEVLESKRTPPPDGATKYIQEMAPKFTKDLPEPPTPLLSYNVTSTIPVNSKEAKVDIKVSDKSGKSLKVKLLSIEFNLGDTEGDLFKAPTVEKGKITGNGIVRAISDTKRFKLTGSGIPNTTNGTVKFQAICTDEKIQPLGETLTISFTGLTNATAGDTKVTINEVLVEREDKAPSTDIEQVCTVTKK
ncbi:hypothetical protein BDV40DRAFT_294545 [Aspergillus tamarii]|uniref:Uncharacterized protein n=1 Tax=Aspergillus tamarii TaxID=41984 RepID=A0A5N6VC40_ASPTM|nr:hypothetical protein BDV40DRAFT_294545 [Aspergillus tamarii]